MKVETTMEMYASSLEALLAELVRERASPFLIEEIHRLWHEARESAGLPTR